MTTAVLRSHDCLNNPHHLSFFDSRPPPTNTKKPSRSPPQKKPKTRSKLNPNRPKPLIPGNVTILKRGEDFKSFCTVKIKSESSYSSDSELRYCKSKPVSAVKIESDSSYSSCTDLCSTARWGPDPTDLKVVYAGPAFVASPAPSALPFPLFIKNKMATKELRCMLRLE